MSDRLPVTKSSIFRRDSPPGRLSRDVDGASTEGVRGEERRGEEREPLFFPPLSQGPFFEKDDDVSDGRIQSSQNAQASRL